MKINIIIPLAGEGSRFKDDYPDIPKPLIKAYSLTLIEIAIKSLGLNNVNFYFIKKKYSNNNYNTELQNLLEKWTLSENIFTLENVLNGPVRTCQIVENKIDHSLPLIITNCDQYLSWNTKAFLDHINQENIDGTLVTYKSKNPKNSFALLKDDYVIKVIEKKVISETALVGIHYWKRTSDFFKSASKLTNQIGIEKEAFISETYNFLIEQGLNISTFNLDEKDFDLIGNSKDLKIFNTKYKTLF